MKRTCEGGQKSALILARVSCKPFVACLHAFAVGAEQEGPGGRWAVTSQLQHTLASGRGNKSRLGRARLPPCYWLDFDAARTLERLKYSLQKSPQMLSAAVLERQEQI